MLCQVASIPVILDLYSVLLNYFRTLLSGCFIAKILAHCFYGFLDYSLPSKQALCPVLARERWRPRQGEEEEISVFY